jgi:hypothetical protein
VLKLSGPQLVVVLVVTLALAYLGYSLAEADRRNLGRGPWGLPSLAWGAIWFFSPILGFVLWLIAHRAEVRRATQSPYAAAPPAAGPAAAPVSASDFPAYPRRADGGAQGAPRAGTPAGAGGSPAGAPATAPGAPTHPPGAGHQVSPPAWHPDPSGRYHYRWWTGSEWTSYVSVHGHVQVDASPDQRIGPY